MNSTPAASRARRTAASFAAVMEVALSESSARRTVATPTAEFSARSSARQRRRARAARIWALVRAGWGRSFMLTLVVSYDMLLIIRSPDDRLSPAPWQAPEEAHECPRWKTLRHRSPFLHRRVGRPDHHGG